MAEKIQLYIISLPKCTYIKAEDKRQEKPF